MKPNGLNGLFYLSFRFILKIIDLGSFSGGKAIKSDGKTRHKSIPKKLRKNDGQERLNVVISFDGLQSMRCRWFRNFNKLELTLK